MATGIPISFSSQRDSSLCLLVTLTVRREKRSTSSVVPTEYMSCNRVNGDCEVINLSLWPPLFPLSPPPALSRLRRSHHRSPNVLTEAIDTHHTDLKFWWLAIENVRGLDPIFDNSDSAIEGTHQMTRIGACSHQMGMLGNRLRENGRTPSAAGRLPRIIRLNLAVVLAHGTEELVKGHRRVNQGGGRGGRSRDHEATALQLSCSSHASHLPRASPIFFSVRAITQQLSLSC